ncbi:hypothetical protein ACNI3Q_06190 [Sphingomonas sp. FW199]|uniref:hypothetical protein n=1 Tax=Sphingomonas sp. FW199 TaxID=3400217 RepID=UPI003CE956DD
MKLMHAHSAGEVGQPISTPAEVYQFRRWRDAHAPGGYFGEPGWDILLRLSIAREQATAMTPAQVRDEIAVPDGAFALVLDRLVDDGMIALVPGGEGAPHIELTDRAIQFIDSVFNFLRPAASPATA